jgi:hypothetical protein
MKHLEYGIVLVVTLVLSYAVFFYQPGPTLTSSGQVIQNAQNQQYFAAQAAQTGSECGDVTDFANVQHLSHHPDRYRDCYAKVDPALLKQATGKTLEQLLAS